MYIWISYGQKFAEIEGAYLQIKQHVLISRKVSKIKLTVTQKLEKLGNCYFQTLVRLAKGKSDEVYSF
jgi:hypothetical protein